MKRHLQLLVVSVAALVIGLNPLIGPVATAYAINGEPVQQDSTAEVADSESNSNSTNDPASSPSNKNQDDSDNLAAEENDPSVVADGSGDVLTDSYQYLYIAYPQLPVGVDQVIAFATPNDSDALTDATLKLESTTGHSLSVSATAVSGNAAAFQFGKDYAECGYDLISISYHLQGDATEHSVDLMQCGYAFDIDANAAVDDGLAEGSANSSVYYSDDSGNAIQAATIGDALTASNGEQSLSLADTAVNGSYVIALDPGHGGVDPGAQGNGKSEADLTWKIAVACKAKLERYGFKVVMSRGQSGSYGSNDFLYRVQRCVKQGAQAFVSFHINSGSSAAHGAEVYAPTANGTSYTKASVELAQKVMNNLSALGLTYRGVFQMTVGDEFAVVRCAREQGIPGILIEHGFISNSGDVWKYFSDAGCKRLGEADADAIIAQFPRSSWMDYSAVFDADYYLKNNPDVAKWANNDKDKALQHFINYGMAEGRRGNEAFDVQSYYNEYPDLRAAYGTNISKYYIHYMKWGKSEGRHGTGTSSLKEAVVTIAGIDYSPVYDLKFYLDHNSDLKKAFIKTTGAGVIMVDDNAALRHFVRYGMAEGRRGNEAFDVRSYYNEYPDLRSAYGTDTAKLYGHYLRYGRAEGRHANGCDSLEAARTSLDGVTYAPVYDFSYYIASSPDVLSAYTKKSECGALVDDAAVLRHFVRCGMAEGRRGNEAFDVRSYYNEYPDLRSAYGTDTAKLYGHYLRYGRAEGRHANGCDSLEAARTSLDGVTYAPVYDFSYYIASSPDVLSAYTKKSECGALVDDAAVLRHFVRCGMAEGRRGNEAFDVYGYKTRYIDLRKAFGNDLKAYYTHFLKYGLKEGRDGSSMTSFEGYIMSPAFSSYEDASAHYARTVGEQAYPVSVYKNKGAATVKEFCKILYEEAVSEGVCPEVLYAQVMKETGYLKFGNLVKADQCNFGGIGATGHGHPGYTFANVREGLRAQVQHLKAYASTEPLNNPRVDPRFRFVSRGCAPKTTDLNGRWAVPGTGYGESLNAIVKAVIGD